MTARKRWPRMALTALLLAAVVGIAMTTALDVWISDGIFAAGGGAWPLPHAGWTRALGYEGPKYALIAFALVLLTGLVRPALLRSIHLERREAVYLLACLALVPATIGALRAESGIACASELVRYGGAVPDWLGQFTVAKLLADNGLHGCFPSGHSSGGFALLALGMLDRKPAARRTLWLVAVLYGSWMGAYQLLHGAHFLSHVLASALIAQLVASVLAIFMLDARSMPVTRQTSIPLARHAQRRT